MRKSNSVATIVISLVFFGPKSKSDPLIGIAETIWVYMEDLIQNLLPNWRLVNENSTVFLFVVLVVPGFIIIFVRSQFITGRIPTYPAGFLSYLTTSTVYWAFLIFLALPVVGYFVSIMQSYGLWWEELSPVIDSIKYIGPCVLIVILPDNRRNLFRIQLEEKLDSWSTGKNQSESCPSDTQCMGLDI